MIGQRYGIVRGRPFRSRGIPGALVNIAGKFPNLAKIQMQYEYVHDISIALMWVFTEKYPT
jgi:hypothetical protein